MISLDAKAAGQGKLYPAELKRAVVGPYTREAAHALFRSELADCPATMTATGIKVASEATETDILAAIGRIEALGTHCNTLRMFVIGGPYNALVNRKHGMAEGAERLLKHHGKHKIGTYRNWATAESAWPQQHRDLDIEATFYQVTSSRKFPLAEKLDWQRKFKAGRASIDGIRARLGGTPAATREENQLLREIRKAMPDPAKRMALLRALQETQGGPNFPNVGKMETRGNQQEAANFPTITIESPNRRRGQETASFPTYSTESSIRGKEHEAANFPNVGKIEEFAEVSSEQARRDDIDFLPLATAASYDLESGCLLVWGLHNSVLRQFRVSRSDCQNMKNKAEFLAAIDPQRVQSPPVAAEALSAPEEEPKSAEKGGQQPNALYDEGVHALAEAPEDEEAS